MTLNCKDGCFLFLFSATTSYRLQRYVIERAVTAKRPVVLLYTGGRDSLFEEAELAAAPLGVEAFALDDVLSNMQEVPLWNSMPPLKLHSIAAIATQPLLRNWLNFLRYRQGYIRRIFAVRELLLRHKVKVVFCSEDGISGDLAAIATARSMGILVVDIPFGNGTAHELEVDLNQKTKNGHIIIPSGRSRWVLEKIAPQWIKKGKHSGTVMYPPEVILAMESTGITLRDAWVIHGGMSDLLCAENQVGLRQYRREGIPEKKLRYTGSPYCDVMVDALKDFPEANAALRQPRRIEDKVTRILVSWPPSYHDSYPGRNEFQSFSDMTRAVFTFLKSLPDTKLTVSLHPACGSEEQDILDELSITVTTDYILELIPLNDIFTTYFSSTIRWALAAGKIVVNYDAYKLGLKTYDEAPGFLNANDFTDFCDTFRHLVSSESVFAELAASQIPNAEEWGIIDGKCTQRIFDEVDRILGT